MFRFFHIVLVLLVVLTLTQCGVKRKISSPDPVEKTSLVGLEGFTDFCQAYDSIHSILISKAEALFISNNERYEALVSIYAIKDSLVYMSVVNSGFEVIRASIDRDSIMVIDRLNKIVYTSAVRKRLGHQNPVDFSDIQNLVSRYYLCDEVEEAREMDFSSLAFQFNEPHIKKSIVLDRQTLLMDRFEFVHSETRSHFLGERTGGAFKIYSNFIADEFEVEARGGSLSYNGSVNVKMQVNRRKYTFVNF